MSDTHLTENDARAFIAPFYDALNAPSTKDVRTLIESIATPQWRSHSANAVSKGREELIQQIIGFGKGVPDLAWTIDEVLVAGNRVIVRSEATGTSAIFDARLDGEVALVLRRSAQELSRQLGASVA